MQSSHNEKTSNHAVSSKEMKIFEKSQFFKKKSYFFMKNAGRQIFLKIRQICINKQPVIVLCGPGNNGGDGFVVAKHLIKNGYKTQVYSLINKNDYKGDSLKALKDYGEKIKKISSFKILKNEIIVDAIFGIGLNRNIKGNLKKIFIKINNSNNKVISIDMPSGISSDTGKILGSAIKANYTVTFHAIKLGQIMKSGKEFCGKLELTDIGFGKKKMKSNLLINSPKLWEKNLPVKKNFHHKYSRGRVVIFGGKKEYTGASMLSAEAALRTGTGSVKILCSKQTLQIYSIKFPSVLKKEINNVQELKTFLKKEKITSMLIGPGSGNNKKIKEITKAILKHVKYVVLDADALTCFKNDFKSLYSLLDKNKIITPHMGEFHKIFPKVKKNISTVDKALSAVKITDSNIILKGSSSIIASHNKKLVINTHDSPELAVIGSGDVLSGIAVSLIGKKKMNPFLACCAAVWLHGDIAKNFGKGLIAEDIVRGIPSALKRLKE